METKVSYDALGNIISEEDPTGAVTKYQYNAESLLTKVTYANNASQTVAYDLAGNAIQETDAEGNTKKYIYDEVNRLTGVTDELGNTTSYAYDAFDNVSRVTDALGHVTEYAYDTHGNLLSETDALGNTVQYSYTPEGWLEQVTKADGNVIRFEYDKTGSLLRQDAGEGYTVSSSYNELGQVTEVGSDAGTITYQYNDQGRLISVTNVNGEKVSYTWDEYGNKTGMVYPDGREVRYTYDIMNRMTEVTGLDGEITRYAYDAAGRRILTENAENTTTYEYDRIGSLICQETTGVGAVTFTYGYNKNGYITKENRTENGTTTESKYTYDAMYPFLCVDNTIESYLSKIEPMHNIYYEITTGVEGGLGNDLALEYFRIGDISNAYRILERKIQFCSTVINRVLSGDVIQQRNQKDKLVSYWRGEQKLAESLLSEMKNEQSSLKDMIEKNICSSKQACALFFKRF